jgi:hypothetical protein
VIDEPPSEAGAVKLIFACALPAVALTAVGAPGTVAAIAGVMLLDAADAGPVPTLLVAPTVQVYAVPFVRPVTVNELAAPDFVTAPGPHVAV